MNRKPLPLDLDGGNGSRLGALTFDIADAPMLIHALAIGANTVMMCGGGQAQDRMRWYRDQIKALTPPGWEHLRREEDLSNIAIAMATSDSWSIHRVLRWRSDKDGETVITVGAKTWSTFSLTAEQHAELASCIAAIAPLSCNRMDREDEVTRSW